MMIMKDKNNYCVILAGGRGRRLWPASKEKYPKQFIDFFSQGRTQLQQTYDRFLRFIPQENIFINTGVEYLDLVKEQLPDVPTTNIMAEPIHRNTAPSVAWVTHRISNLNPKARIVVSPSDQSILNSETFEQNILEGLDFVGEKDYLLTMGVLPTRPEVGYGYIQEGEFSGTDGIYKVKAFTEKPNHEFAEMFVNSKEWYWNTGLFLANAACLIDCLSKCLPSVLRNFDQQNATFNIEAETEFINQYFPSYPNLSIDYGVLEKSENVFVMKCDFGWADLGTWHGIYEMKSRGEGDNVVIDSDVLLENSRGNIIRLNKGKLAIIDGLEDFIVAENDNVLLICKREDSSSLVRKHISEVRLKKGEDYV